MANPNLGGFNRAGTVADTARFQRAHPVRERHRLAAHAALARRRKVHGWIDRNLRRRGRPEPDPPANSRAPRHADEGHERPPVCSLSRDVHHCSRHAVRQIPGGLRARRAATDERPYVHVRDDGTGWKTVRRHRSGNYPAFLHQRRWNAGDASEHHIPRQFRKCAAAHHGPRVRSDGDRVKPDPVGNARAIRLHGRRGLDWKDFQIDGS